MASLSELQDALVNADKAGDAEAARQLADAIHAMRRPSSQEKRGLGQKILDKAGAFASGFNRAYVSRAGLPFNPVDAVANVVDLGKAAVGAPYIALSGKAPPKWLELSDRSGVVGSGEWIVNQARKNALGRAALDAPNPEDSGGYVQAMGGGAGGGVGGGASRGQELVNAGMGATSALASKLTTDLGGSDDLAIAAGMFPQAAARGGSTAAKKLIRGGEKGRLAMAQRIQDLKAAGIDAPSLGLASGNRWLQGIENLLASTPGAAGQMEAARQKVLAGLRNKAEATADSAATTRGADVAGAAIKAGLNETFKDKFKAGQGRLYGELDSMIPANTPTNVDRTQGTLAGLNADIPGAPNLSPLFKNGKIQSIEAALKADLTGPRAYTPEQLRAALATNPQRASELNAALGEGALPYKAISKLRTLVGSEIADSNMMSDVPRSKWNPLYGAVSDDLRGVAAATSPQAESAFNRANNYTRAGIGRMDRVAPYADAAAPEQAFTSLFNTTKENASTFQSVKKSLPEGARATIAGTVVERLGRATPGKQNELGDVWSPESFLTNWNKMTPKARDEVFSGFKNADQVKADVEAIAKATAKMRDSAAIWANPSGTAPHLGAKGIVASLLAGGLINPMLPAAAVAGIGGANFAARGLLSNRVRDFASRQSNASDLLDPANPGLLQQLVNIPQMRGLLSQ